MMEMERAEQYEIWACTDDGRWEFVASFVDLRVASALAQARKRHVRLVRAVYEACRKAEEEVLAEIGAVRSA